MEKDRDFKEKLLDKVRELPGVKLLWKYKIDNFCLVGGAIYDSLEGSNPKDYDLLRVNPDTLYLKGFKYLYSTEYSTTFEKDGMRFQVLKTDLKDFDFTISTIEFRSCCRDYSTKVESYLYGDFMNLELKNLVPVHSNSF